MSSDHSQGPPSPATPAAGWYNNPDGEGLRWWDGSKWTDHVQAEMAPGSPETGEPRPRVRRAHAGRLGLGLLLIGLVLGGAYLTLLSGNGSDASESDETNVLADHEAARLLDDKATVERMCRLAAKEPRGNIFLFYERLDAAGEDGARAIQDMKAFYRMHPDAVLATGETTRQVLADTITVLTFGGPGLDTDCAPADAMVLERELDATP